MPAYRDSLERKGRMKSLEEHHGFVVINFSRQPQLPDEYEVGKSQADGLYHWIDPSFESTGKMSSGFSSSVEAWRSCLSHIDGETEGEPTGTQQ